MDYDGFLEFVNGLDVIKENGLEDSAIAKITARLAHDHDIRDGVYLSEVVLRALAADPNLRWRSSITLSPTVEISAEYLEQLVAPWVSATRRDVFGTEDPPFTSFEAAHDWIQRERRDGWASWQQENAHTETPRDPPLVWYGGSDDELYCAYAVPGSRLHGLIDAVQEIAAFTRFDPGSTLLHITAGAKPYLPPFRITSPGERRLLSTNTGPKEIHRSYLNVELNVPPTREALLALYRFLRELQQNKRKKSLRPRHLRLYWLVQKKGPPPRGKGASAFWTATKQEWKTTYPEEKDFGDWRGFKIAYRRILQRMPAQY